MTQTPFKKQVPINNAAKDDTVGTVDGVHTFSINDLLANDPGGAAKVSIGTQFFFGDDPTKSSPADQAAYMAEHGIVKISDDNGGTYDIGVGATDFNYFVQIGNSGTWSEAHVTVNAPVPHTGVDLFTENFDGYAGQMFQDHGATVFEVTDLNVASGWSGAGHTELGADGYGGVPATSGGAGGFWLDTQNSPGGVDISHGFIDNTAPVAGKTSVLSFDVAKQSLDYQGQHYATDPNAAFTFKIDGVAVATVHASDLAISDQMYHFDFNIAAYADPGIQHTLELVDTSPDAYTGFSIDSIHIHDWII